MSLLDPIKNAATLSHTLGQAVLGLREAGVLAPVTPFALWRIVRSLRRSGRSPAALLALSAARWPQRAAVIDERGSLSFTQLQEQVEALAAALAAQHGLGPGKSVALMCRNHAGLIAAMLAVMRLGCDVVFLNTEFPAPQLALVLERHDFAVAIHDEEFTGVFEQAGYPRPRILAWQDRPSGENTLAALAARGAAVPPRPKRPGKMIILTSGTTGTPKAADRNSGALNAAGAVATILRRAPFRAGAPLLIAPPIFHGFGLALCALALALGAPIVIRRRFEAEALLSDLVSHQVKLLMVVPVMLQRLLDVPNAAAYDLSGLDAVICAAAPLSGTLALRWMDTHGDKLYNGYGSTEAGFVALAAPADLRAAPGCVGRAPIGVATRIMDAEGREKPVGETGHICVGSRMLIEGYVGGGNKSRLGGLMNTGDLGHYDADGRLYVDGREDDMIVSGGENVFPQEVEEALAGHPGVRDAAVIGVADAEFGQRLKAFVVRGDEALDAEALKAHLRGQIARYKLPREFVFVTDLPRNPSGKVLRRKLAEL